MEISAKCNNHPGKLNIASILSSAYILTSFSPKHSIRENKLQTYLSTFKLNINFPVKKSGAVGKQQSDIFTWFT